MAYGDDLNITLPTDGSADWGEGALNGVLEAIIAVLETRVTAAGIDLQGDLDFAGNSADDLASAGFRNISTNPPVRGISFKSNELWVTDGAGNSFALTSNGAINVSVAGSITGLAGSNGSVVYSQSNARFTFLAADDGAAIEAGSVRLRRSGTSTVTTLRASTSLASDYEVVYPSGTIAGGTGLVTMDSDGQLGVSKDPSVNTITVAGSASFAGAISSTQILNAVSIALTGSMQMTGSMFQVNAPTQINGTFARTNITGTFLMSGSYAFVERRRTMGPRTDAVMDGVVVNTEAGVTRSSGNPSFVHRLELDTGTRIKSYAWTYQKDAGSGLTGTLGYTRVDGQAHDIIAFTAAAANTGSALIGSALTASIKVAAFQHYWIRFDMNNHLATTPTITVSSVELVYDRPEA